MKKMRSLRLRDFPGMESVCLLHAMWYEDHGDVTWRAGGTPECLCERSTDALVRLRAEAAWARQDEAKARADAEQAESEIARIERGSRPRQTEDVRWVECDLCNIQIRDFAGPRCFDCRLITTPSGQPLYGYVRDKI